MANMVEGGRTPVVDKKTLEEIGYSLAIFPAFGFLAAGEALRNVYSQLKENGSSVGCNVPLYKFSEFSELMGFGAVAEVRQDLSALMGAGRPGASLKPERAGSVPTRSACASQHFAASCHWYSARAGERDVRRRQTRPVRRRTGKATTCRRPPPAG